MKKQAKVLIKSLFLSELLAIASEGFFEFLLCGFINLKG